MYATISTKTEWLALLYSHLFCWELMFYEYYLYLFTYGLYKARFG